jgi:tetratricopeptide (TPR) repeat protein
MAVSGNLLTRRYTTAVLAFLLAIGTLLQSPALVGRALSNLGMIAFRDALMSDSIPQETGRESDVYSLFETLREEDVEIPIALLQRAAALDPSSLTIRWGLGRIALASGNLTTATETLELATDQARHNPLLYQDALTAFSYGGMPEQVIALYESSALSHPTQTLSDTVAVAYLTAKGQEALEKVRDLRPGDLYANYYLRQAAQRAGDLAGAEAFTQELIHFPLEAISPTDERLFEYIAAVIPALLDEGLWNLDTTRNVVSFLTWQHDTADGVEQLLKQLVERYPAEPDWPFYLGEFYHRQGNVEQAEKAYQQALTVDLEYPHAYLRLGLLSESENSGSAFRQRLKSAAKMYEQYYSRVPDDLLGLKRLTKVCTMLEQAGTSDESCRQAAERALEEQSCAGAEGNFRPCLTAQQSPATVLREVFEDQIDDRRIAAGTLGVPLETVELGPNLVRNGGGEELDNGGPREWIWADMATGNPWNKGVFTGGLDSLDALWGDTATHIEGFWLQTKPELEPGRVGYWQWDEQERKLGEIEILPGQPYLISFYYHTEQISDNSVALWVSHDEAVLFAGYHHLPPTDGKWLRFTRIAWNRTESPKKAQLLVSLFSPGGVWFDNVVVRPLMLKTGSAETPAPNGDTD